jgi:hypothetical protein
MSNSESPVGVIISIAIYLAVLFGWGSNIYKFTQCDFEGNMKEEVIRGIGIPVFPIGVIAGYVDL